MARASSGSFSRRFAKQWWCTAPKHFVERQLPGHSTDQLLEQPVSKSQWERMVDSQWAPTTFLGMNDGDEILAPCGGIMRKGQTAEFRILLNEDTPSTLKLKWGGDWGETLRSQRVQRGHEHSITVPAWRVQPELGCRSGMVQVTKQGRTMETLVGTTTDYSTLAEWKIQ